MAASRLKAELASVCAEIRGKNEELEGLDAELRDGIREIEETQMRLGSSDVGLDGISTTSTQGVRRWASEALISELLEQVREMTSEISRQVAREREERISAIAQLRAEMRADFDRPCATPRVDFTAGCSVSSISLLKAHLACGDGVSGPPSECGGAAAGAVAAVEAAAVGTRRLAFERLLDAHDVELAALRQSVDALQDCIAGKVEAILWPFHIHDGSVAPAKERSTRASEAAARPPAAGAAATTSAWLAALAAAAVSRPGSMHVKAAPGSPSPGESPCGSAVIVFSSGKAAVVSGSASLPPRKASVSGSSGTGETAEEPPACWFEAQRPPFRSQVMDWPSALGESSACAGAAADGLEPHGFAAVVLHRIAELSAALDRERRAREAERSELEAVADIHRGDTRV